MFSRYSCCFSIGERITLGIKYYIILFIVIIGYPANITTVLDYYRIVWRRAVVLGTIITDTIYAVN